MRLVSQTVPILSSRPHCIVEELSSDGIQRDHFGDCYFPISMLRVVNFDSEYPIATGKSTRLKRVCNNPLNG
jgi:hypothetical protein